jgi:hypothetical protein
MVSIQQARELQSQRHQNPCTEFALLSFSFSIPSMHRQCSKENDMQRSSIQFSILLLWRRIRRNKKMTLCPNSSRKFGGGDRGRMSSDGGE